MPGRAADAAPAAEAKLVADKEDALRRVSERDQRLTALHKQLVAAQQNQAKQERDLAVEQSGHAHDQAAAQRVQTALKQEIAAAESREAELVTRAERADEHAEALRNQLQACARTEEDLRRTLASVQSEIAVLKAAAARSAEEVAAGSVRDAATAEGRVALQSKRDELHRTVARLKAELAKTKAEAKRTDQRTFLLLKRLLSERETLSKQRDLAYEQMEAANSHTVEERLMRERSDEAAAVAHAEARLRAEEEARIVEMLPHEIACMAFVRRELDAARAEMASLQKLFARLEAERSALAEKASAAGAQLAKALEKNARRERERRDLFEVCCRQEQHWRACVARPTHVVDAVEALNEWTLASRALDRCGVEVAPLLSKDGSSGTEDVDAWEHQWDALSEWMRTARVLDRMGMEVAPLLSWRQKCSRPLPASQSQQ